MPLATWQVVLFMGLFFLLLGIVAILWNRREQEGYYDSISAKRDVKEFLTHEPNRSWLGAWLIGGKLFIIIGIALIIVSIILK